MPLAMHPGHLVPLPLLLLLLQTTTVVSNPATHQYPPPCVPPPGAFPDPNAVTYPPNTTDNPYLYVDPLLPIDYCCPQTNLCEKKSGFCALNWLIDTVLPECCDFNLPEMCKDYGCGCCIKCSRDKCSKCTKHGGNCRVKCRADEKRDYFKKCSFENCHCCKKCTENDECTDAKGKCFANHYDCPAGTYASTGCCGGCYCCKPEQQKLKSCERKTGSYCSPVDDCDVGYYPCFGECVATEYVGGNTQIVPGYCCAPKIPAAPSGRIGAFDYFMNKVAGDSLSGNQQLDEEILPAELDDLSPRTQSGNSQESAQEVVEDQIYDEVEPVEKKVHQYIIDDSVGSDKDGDVAIDSPIDVSDQGFPSDLKIDQNDNEVEEKNKNNDKHHRRKHHKSIEDGDMDADMAIDSPIDISDQVPLSDLEVDQNDNKVEENNNKDEQIKHHRRKHHKNVESKLRDFL